MVDGGRVGVPVPFSLHAGLVHRVSLTAGASTLPLPDPPFIVAGDPPPLQSRTSSRGATCGLASLSSTSWVRDDARSPLSQPPLGMTPMPVLVPMFVHPVLLLLPRQQSPSHFRSQGCRLPPSRVGRSATTILRQLSCSKNWKPYKIETKDICIQAYYLVLQLDVGC